MSRREKAICLAVLILIGLSVASLVISLTRGPGARSYPYAQVSRVDYDKIGQLIDQKLASLPKAQPGPAGANGMNGLNGNAGLQGMPGAQGTQGIMGQQGPAGPQGTKGDQGDPGAPGASVVLRTNPLTLNLEWKYSTDDTWRILELHCQIAGTCG